MPLGNGVVAAAKELVAAKDFAGALTLLEDRDDEAARSLRGACLWKLRRLEEARAVFSTLLPARKKSFDAVVLEMKAQQLEAANRVRGDGLGDAQKARDCASLYSAIDLEEPSTAGLRFHVRYNCGLCHLEAQDFRDAARVLEAAIRECGSLVVGEEERRTVSALALHNLGEARRQLGDFPGAVDAFTQAVDHGSEVSRKGLVEAALQQGNRCDLVFEHVDVLLRAPSSSSSSRKEAYSDDSSESSAVRSDALFWRGLAKLETCDAQGAAEDFEASLDLHGLQRSGDVPTANVRAALFEATAKCGEVLLMERQLPAEAVPSFERALDVCPAKEPRRRQVAVNLAVALARAGRPDDAVAALQRIGDDDRKTLLTLATVCLDAGKFFEADAAFTKAIFDFDFSSEKKDNDKGAEEEALTADLAYNCGFARYKLDKLAGARAAFLLCLALDPDHDGAEKALGLVDDLLAARSRRERAELAALASEAKAAFEESIDDQDAATTRELLARLLVEAGIPPGPEAGPGPGPGGDESARRALEDAAAKMEQPLLDEGTREELAGKHRRAAAAVDAARAATVGNDGTAGLVQAAKAELEAFRAFKAALAEGVEGAKEARAAAVAKARGAVQAAVALAHAADRQRAIADLRKRLDDAKRGQGSCTAVRAAEEKLEAALGHAEGFCVADDDDESFPAALEAVRVAADELAEAVADVAKERRRAEKAARQRRAAESRRREVELVERLEEEERAMRRRAQEFYDALQRKHLTKTHRYDVLVAPPEEQPAGVVVSKEDDAVVDDNNNNAEPKAGETIQQQHKFFPLESLLVGAPRLPPEVVDRSQREKHLDDETFLRVFSMDKGAFASLPKWQQAKLKKERGLF